MRRNFDEINIVSLHTSSIEDVLNFLNLKDRATVVIATASWEFSQLRQTITSISQAKKLYALLQEDNEVSIAFECFQFDRAGV